MKFITISLLLTSALGAQALLQVRDEGSTDRYIPGAYSSVASTIETADHGFLNVGEDGVLRSFAGNGTVLDYHQLDPEQVKEFAETQLRSWDHIDHETPEVVRTMAKEPYPDGRLVHDLKKLLHPEGWEAMAMGTTAEARSTRSDAKQVIEKLRGLDKRQACLGAFCESLNQCAQFRPTPCFQCYFPNPVPVGACMLQ